MPSHKIFVAGHRGMVGSAIVRQLQKEPTNEIITATREELDLTNQTAVNDFLAQHKVDQIYLAAAKVGGIHANNTYPADFIYENLMIQANVIHAAHKTDVQKLLFLGSSCIYPRLAEQPMSESALLTASLEPTNEPYAIAKIAGIKLCESYNRQYGRDYRSVMPTNLYGPGDNYHPENSHVIPALIRRFHEAKQKNLPEVVAWGTGTPRREFLFVDDMAEASEFVMNLEIKKYQANTKPNRSQINVGSGEECSIKELTELVARTIGYNGKIIWNSEMPDGSPRKLLDLTALHGMQWRYKTALIEGLKQTYDAYLLSMENAARTKN